MQLIRVIAMPRPRISEAAAAAIRAGPDDRVLHLETTPRSPKSQKSQCDAMSRAKSVTLGTEEIVQVWLAGDWKPLTPAESLDILAHRDADICQFEITARGTNYSINLDAMTQTNLKTGRCRTMRIRDKFSTVDMGFDEFREAFQRRASRGNGGLQLSAEALMSSWPCDGDDNELLTHTVHDMLRKMVLRRRPYIDMAEWIHYWALERDGASASAIEEVNVQLQKALLHDPQVLGRLQMQFEAVAEPVAGSCCLGLSRDGLAQVCKRIVASPQDTKEKQWAQELLAKSGSEEVVEDDEDLSYCDYLNVMLGRKRYKVYLWMYDISNGFAERWSWLVLGKEHKGFWHTGLVVEWPDRKSEFWFGGKVFESIPGTSPFGNPVEKRFLGYTYKRHREVRQWLVNNVVDKFTKENYDVKTHNCNHFSDSLSMHLRNEHIPEEIVRQSETILETPAVKVLQPLLNRWLGGFDGKDGQSPSMSCEQLDCLGVLAVVEFSKEEGGRASVGRVEDMQNGFCTVTALDFWRECPVELDIKEEHIVKVLTPGLQNGRSIPSIAQLVKSSTHVINGHAHQCCWFPSFAACLESSAAADHTRRGPRTLSRQSGHEMCLRVACDYATDVSKEVEVVTI